MLSLVGFPLVYVRALLYIHSKQTVAAKLGVHFNVPAYGWISQWDPREVWETQAFICKTMRK